MTDHRDHRGLADDQTWARLRDRLFTFMALGAILAFFITSYFTVQTNRTVAAINARQIEAVQNQNFAQLCTQHEIIVAIRSVSRELGLPTGQIPVPDVRGLDCMELLDIGGEG